MITIYYIAALAFLVIIYILISRYSDVKAKPKLDEVEAGPTGSMIMGRTRNYKTMPLRPQDSLFANDGTPISFQNYKQFVVKGTCMEAKKIYEGDIIIAELFNDGLSDNQKLEKINTGDILLIYLDDNKFKGHKIRVCSEKTEGKSFLKTHYFNKDKTVHPSSREHNIEEIIGVIRMKLND
jgi:TusA-related sulfurtransferase